jgi:hypothetical protein
MALPGGKKVKPSSMLSWPERKEDVETKRRAEQ